MAELYSWLVSFFVLIALLIVIVYQVDFSNPNFLFYKYVLFFGFPDCLKFEFLFQICNKRVLKFCYFGSVCIWVCFINCYSPREMGLKCFLAMKMVWMKLSVLYPFFVFWDARVLGTLLAMPRWNILFRNIYSHIISTLYFLAVFVNAQV